MSPETRGPAAVRHAMRDFLREWLPQHIDSARLAWGLDDVSLPKPVSAPGQPREDAYLAGEPEAIDRWPLVAVQSGRRTLLPDDFDAETGDPIFTATYPMRVFSWVRAEGHEGAQAMRDNLATVLQVTLLSHVSLGTDFLQLVPSTVLVDFSSIVKVKGERYVAGSFVGFEVRATETLTDRLAMPGAGARDTVSTVTVGATPLPNP